MNSANFITGPHQPHGSGDPEIPTQELCREVYPMSNNKAIITLYPTMTDYESGRNPVRVFVTDIVERISQPTGPDLFRLRIPRAGTTSLYGPRRLV